MTIATIITTVICLYVGAIVIGLVYLLYGFCRDYHQGLCHWHAAWENDTFAVHAHYGSQDGAIKISFPEKLSTRSIIVAADGAIIHGISWTNGQTSGPSGMPAWVHRNIIEHTQQLVVMHKLKSDHSGTASETYW